MQSNDPTKTGDESEAAKTRGNPAPAFSGGHKAIIEVNFTYRTEADPNSESVKNFLKAVGEFSQGRTIDATKANK